MEGHRDFCAVRVRVTVTVIVMKQQRTGVWGTRRRQSEREKNVVDTRSCDDNEDN